MFDEASGGGVGKVYFWHKWHAVIFRVAESFGRSDSYSIIAAARSGEGNVKITLVLLAAYAIVGAFHSGREFYRGRKTSPELLPHQNLDIPY
jgi:hypothetical protein